MNIRKIQIKIRLLFPQYMKTENCRDIIRRNKAEQPKKRDTFHFINMANFVENESVN